MPKEARTHGHTTKYSDFLADKFHFTRKHGKMVQGYSGTFYHIGINKSDFRRKYLREREATHESRIRKRGL